MTVYRKALRNTVGDVTIETQEGVPALFLMASDPKFPLDRAKLAENLVAVLNGREPHNRLAGGSVNYSRQENTLMLHWRNGGQGVGQPAMIIAASDQTGLGQDALARLDSKAMKAFCAAVRNDGPSSAPAPRGKPSPGMGV